MQKVKNRTIEMLFIYVMFVLTRFKKSSFFKIDGISIERIVVIICIISVFLLFLNINKIKLNSKKLFLFFCLSIVIIIGLFKSENYSQVIYALLLAVVPLFAFFYKPTTLEKKNRVLRVIIYVNLFYSVLIIFSSLNYGFIMEILGNRTSNIVTQGQHRVGSMLGSSIATAVYQNLSLSIIFYILDNKPMLVKKSMIYIVLLLNIISTLTLLSRLPFIVMLINIFIYMIVMKNNYLFKKIILSTLILILVFLIMKRSRIDISRLFKGFSDTSVNLRISSLRVALKIFSDNLLLGSGVARHYPRIYSDTIVYYGGLTGLIDPHNLYALILSEIGLIGGILLIVLIIKIIDIQKLKCNPYSQFLMISILLNSFGGSHMLNNPNISFVFWFYLSILLSEVSE